MFKSKTRILSNYLNLLAVVFLTGLVAGCATVSEQKNVLQIKTVKVNSFTEMQFTPVVLEQVQALTLDGDTPTFLFSEGKSYYAAVSLPVANQARYLSYQTNISGVPLNLVNALIPRFAFLDQAKQLLGTAVATQHHRKNGDFFQGTSFSGRVQVPPTASYVVIYAADKIEESLFVPANYGKKWPLALAPSGSLSFSVTTQAVATITDSWIFESSKKAQLFMVTEVDGQSIQNSDTESSSLSKGAGARLYIAITARDVPAKPLKLKLVATHITGAPIHEIFSQAAGTFYSVKGVVDFTPAAGGKYVVKGILKKEGSSVWLEDAVTGQVVTEKIVER